MLAGFRQISRRGSADFYIVNQFYTRERESCPFMPADWLNIINNMHILTSGNVADVTKTRPLSLYSNNLISTDEDSKVKS